MFELKWFPIVKGDMEEACVPVKVHGVIRLCVLKCRESYKAPSLVEGPVEIAAFTNWQTVEVDGFS